MLTIATKYVTLQIKAKGEKMTKRKAINIPVTAEQEKRIKEAADKMEMTVSGFMRFVAFEKAKEINKEK